MLTAGTILLSHVSLSAVSLPRVYTLSGKERIEYGNRLKLLAGWPIRSVSFRETCLHSESK